MSERVTNQRLAEMIANLADSTGWFGDIYDGLRELQERRASSPAAGRDAVIEECARVAAVSEASDDVGYTNQEVDAYEDAARDIAANIRSLKETPNGN